MKTHEKESVNCQCYNCGKRSTRVYNFTLGKWARAFRCRCGSESFSWTR